MGGTTAGRLQICGARKICFFIQAEKAKERNKKLRKGPFRKTHLIGFQAKDKFSSLKTLFIYAFVPFFPFIAGLWIMSTYIIKRYLELETIGQ